MSPKCILCQALEWQLCSDPHAMEQRARLLGDTGQLWTFHLTALLCVLLHVASLRVMF